MTSSVDFLILKTMQEVNYMNCQICGKKLELNDTSNVDVTIADGRGTQIMNRHFVACEKCACKVLALIVTSDLMCKKCDKEAIDEKDIH